MAIILNIETSTDVCSVAISKDGKCLAEKINKEGFSHTKILNVFIKEMIDEVNKLNLKINAISVSCGPGSYTGLRIGVSTAKGLAYGFGVPLISVKTLELMASEVIEKENIDNNTLLCPMIDARRMEVYNTFFDKNLNEYRKTNADIIEENSYNDILNNYKVLFFGNGAEKCKNVLKNKNVEYINNIYPKANSMIKLAEKAFKNKIFEDIAYFEPFYLKDFVATVSKKNIIK